MSKKTTILNIAGHGRNKDGSFDTGATGFITMGEHRYYANVMFPAMKKALPKNTKYNWVFYTERSVYSYGDIVQLAKRYGNDTIVNEWHYDAFTPNASGGHVIVYSGYAPDKHDLAIRDVIDKHIGVRYTHRGHKGISGRSDLLNVNLTRHGGVDYRLTELGFGTNKRDSQIMMNNVDAIARDFVRAFEGTANTSTAPTTNTPKKATGDTYTVKKGDTLWGIANANGVTVTQLREWNNIKGDLINIGQKLQVKPPKQLSKFKPLKKGDTATIGTWATQYETGEAVSDWIKGTPLKVDDIKDVNKSQSVKAYKLLNGKTVIGWVLEQDIVEADNGQRKDEIADMKAVKEADKTDKNIEVVEEKTVEESKEQERIIENDDNKVKDELFTLPENEFILDGKRYRINQKEDLTK